MGTVPQQLDKGVIMERSGDTEKKRLYVGCGLTDAPKAFTDEVAALKEELKADWNVLEFLGITAGGRGDVYQKDIIENVGSCDAFLAVMDERSWGLGFETRDALLNDKPSLMVARTGGRVTRLALDAVVFFPGQLDFKQYDSMVEDVPGIVREHFQHVLNPEV